MNQGLQSVPPVALAVLMLLTLMMDSPAYAQTSVPAEPTGLTAASVAHDSVELAWDNPGDSAIAGYKVLRRSCDGADYGDGLGASEFLAVVDDTGTAETSYTDMSVTPHTRYVYRVKARNSHGLSNRSRYLNVETHVAPPDDSEPANEEATGSPVITGTPEIGETLTVDASEIADANGLDGVDLNFQWVSNDGQTDTDIADATESSYTITRQESGKTIKVRVSFTDEQSFSESRTSEVTPVVAPIPNTPATGVPLIIGTAKVGVPLTALTSDIRDDNGLSGTKFNFQWLSIEEELATAIQGAIEEIYTPSPSNYGKPLKVLVSFNDDEGFLETLTSDATTGVRAPGICDRSLAVQKNLLPHMRRVSDCSRVTESHLGGFEGHLNLSGEGLSGLRAEDLQGLTSLQELYLSNDYLTELPHDVFGDLQELRKLFLQQNLLSELPENIFDGLPHLVLVDLSWNDLRRVPERILRNSGELRSIDLSENELEVLSAGLFSKLPELTDLKLSDNTITELPEGVFDNNANL